jgi:hypothetical protein
MVVLFFMLPKKDEIRLLSAAYLNFKEQKYGKGYHRKTRVMQKLT